MTKYIPLKAAKEAVHRIIEPWPNLEEDIYDLLDEIPSADVVERKKGKWQITDAYPHNVYCSECHKKFAQTHWAVWEDGSLSRNFCPNCGAEMSCPQSDDN